MTMIVAPFTIDSICVFVLPPLGNENEEQIKRNHLSITCWGIDLNDKRIPYVSSKNGLNRKSSGWING